MRDFFLYYKKNENLTSKFEGYAYIYENWVLITLCAE